MILIVGLGNPGSDYARNRHNVGFMAVDEITRRYGFGPWRRRFQGEVGEGRIDGRKALALKPMTYMNESGRSVGEAVRFFKLEPEQVFVLYDEIDLRPGKLRVKRGGGAGGHNGIRSIDAHLGGHLGNDYWRLRMGVGHPGDKTKVRGHVLRDFAKADEAWLGKFLDAIAAELPLLLKGDDGAFMSRVAHVMTPPKPAPKAESKSEPRPEPEAEPKAKPTKSDGEATKSTPSKDEASDGI